MVTMVTMVTMVMIVRHHHHHLAAAGRTVKVLDGRREVAGVHVPEPAPDEVLRRGAWARVTIDRFRRLALQTL